MKKQTAVEWLVEEFTYKTTNGIYTTDGTDDVTDIVNKAKEMEKEQIIEALGVGFNDGQSYMDGKPKYNSAEQYYNETFKSE